MNRYFKISTKFPYEIVELEENPSETTKFTLVNSIVWTIDTEIFPIKEDNEIKDYFLSLYNHPNQTLVHAGFDSKKYH